MNPDLWIYYSGELNTEQSQLLYDSLGVLFPQKKDNMLGLLN